ncbi:MAG TPA: hypothetical protein VNE18_01930 [Rhodanobacter sp.]|nr:hypothetical protein [Acetobacteraceae bacterium]HVC16039.1 hypothetical protein [Rhodanobacter sp.]
MNRGGLARRALLLVVSLLWLLGGAEALARFTGGWRFDRLHLVARPRAAPTASSAATRQAGERALLADATYSGSVDPDWFFLPPTPIKEPSSRRLLTRSRNNPTAMGQENYVWNDAAFGPHPDLHLLDLLRTLKEQQIFAFHSYDGTILPRYRLYPDNDFRPTPWITDRYGWLSVRLRTPKPPYTIRIGIIGDSTSQNFYGRQLQAYLNAWAAATHLGVSFQVLNGARQGLEQQDELAVLKYEMAPMGLDYVYAYFAPTFAVAGYTQTFARLPPGVSFGHPPPPRPGWWARAVRQLAPLAQVSALARALVEQWTGTAPGSLLTEPSKPPVRLELPAGARGRRVDLARAEKNPYLGGLIGDLDRLRRIAGSIGATPIVSDEHLCVWKGMVVNGTTHHLLYDDLNGPLFWPLSYAEIRRLLDMHNATIDTWARAQHVPVVDIDGHYPRDPDLCSDTFHDLPLGMRLRAWIIFQRLIPLIRRDLAAGIVPRANADPSGHNPAFAAPIQELDRTALLRWMQAELATERAAKQ